MNNFVELWSGGPRFAQSEHFKLGTDSVLLADFVNTGSFKRGIDLGTGSGILPLLLLTKSEKLHMTGLEINEDACLCAEANLAENGLCGRGEIICGDIRACREQFKSGEFDLVVANPPYFAEGSGYTSPDVSRAAARDERNCSLDDICRAASYLCRTGGVFCLVHRAERLSEVFCKLTEHGLEPKRLRTVSHSAQSEPSLVLIEARRGGKTGLKIMPPLFLRKEDGSETDEVLRIYHREEKSMSGKLYLVGTPIGNLGDFSPRAVETLRNVDFIAAEDTRVTLKLLNHFDIRKPMVSYYEHNKYASGAKIFDRIAAGESCALVTDAGMPAISDPGEDIVRMCAENGVDVVTVPGPSALISAVALSALPTQRFCFEGFLSTSNKSRREHLESLVSERRTMIFYEAPHKLMRTLEDMKNAFGGDRKLSLCRELTKIHEQTLRTTFDGAIEYFTENPPKGEFVLVIDGAPEEKIDCTIEDALALVEKYRSEGLSHKAACKKAAPETGFNANELYNASLK